MTHLPEKNRDDARESEEHWGRKAGHCFRDHLLHRAVRDRPDKTSPKTRAATW